MVSQSGHDSTRWQVLECITVEQPERGLVFLCAEPDQRKGARKAGTVVAGWVNEIQQRLTLCERSSCVRVLPQRLALLLEPQPISDQQWAAASASALSLRRISRCSCSCSASAKLLLDHMSDWPLSHAERTPLPIAMPILRRRKDTPAPTTPSEAGCAGVVGGLFAPT